MTDILSCGENADSPPVHAVCQLLEGAQNDCLHTRLDVHGGDDRLQPHVGVTVVEEYLAPQPLRLFIGEVASAIACAQKHRFGSAPAHGASDFWPEGAETGRQLNPGTLCAVAPEESLYTLLLEIVFDHLATPFKKEPGALRMHA
jgi:hypothetical protein